MSLFGKKCIGVVYSNFDHQLEEELVKKLKITPNSYAEHCAWNFWGAIWYEHKSHKKFFELVRVYQVDKGIFENKSIKNLIKKVNQQFGGD